MIIVFGAAGFIGTYLIDELLKRNYQVIGADINNIGEDYYKKLNVPYFHVDITKKKSFDKIQCGQIKTVIHLAAIQPANVSEKKHDPGDYIYVNTIGTINILEFCKKVGVEKLIYASSHRNTQGLWAKGRAIREDDGRSIEFSGEYSMFSISESAAQDCVEYYHKQFGLKSIIFRLPPVYGYGPHTEIFKHGKPIKTGFQVFIENAMACKPIEIWGDSSKGRDIIYVKDVVSACIKALSNDKANGLYNIASGKYLSLREEAETIAKTFWGNNSAPEIIERPELHNSIDTFIYDISKAKRELGWSPQYNFEKMLIDYKKEMKSNRFGYLIEKRRLMFNEG
jgi:UDP-glucose 4-epimerase